MTDRKHGALQRSHTNFFGVRLQIFANQANPFYIESIRNKSFLSDDFKNLKSVGAPWFA
jgi:hypothetical protein